MATELVLRFVAGGSVVVLVSLLARINQELLAGVAVLFPAVTLVSYAFLFMERGVEATRPLLLVTALALPCVLVFVLSLYWATSRLDVSASFIVALGAWIAAASLVIGFIERFQHHLPWLDYFWG